MPEGIVPELLIVLTSLIVIAASVVIARRSRGPRPPAEPDAAPRPGGDVAVAPRPTEAVEAPPTARPTLRERLVKSRRFLSDQLAGALGRTDDEAWDDLEAVLIQADIGVDAAARLTAAAKATSGKISKKNGAWEELRGVLATELNAAFEVDRERTLAFAPEGTSVWLVMGVNGTGKTTTIGKLAHDLKERGRSVALAAADTFRAAADEQLGIWATRAGAEIVKHQHGADPGAVAFDAFKHARAKGTDVLIVDTAGRLHTKTPLMDELAKVRRVIEKEGRVHEALLVIDATSGQNGLAQAREFTAAAGVTGIVLTKLDGTAKGGIALAIESDLGIPIKLIGVGEGIDDLEPFEPKAFVDALLS